MCPTKSALAHKRADWPLHPRRLGGPQRFNAADKISTGPQLGGLATAPLPFKGSPTLQCGGQNQNWPTCGRIGDFTPAGWGPQCWKAGDKIGSGPEGGGLAMSPLLFEGSPTLQNRTKSQGAHNWVDWLRHPCQRGTKSELALLWVDWLRHPCRLRVPNACERGIKSEVAHNWAD